MELIINQIGYSIDEDPVHLYYTNIFTPNTYSLKYKWFIEEIIRCGYQGHEITFDNFKTDDEIYYTFSNKLNKSPILILLQHSWTFKRTYIRESLASYFESRNIVDRFPLSSHLSVYIQNQLPLYKNEWESYKVFNLTINKYYISIALASRDTFISKSYLPELKSLCTKLIIGKSIYHQKRLAEESNPERIIANWEIKNILEIKKEYKKLSYQNNYKQIDDFYKQCLLNYQGKVKFFKNGFRKLDPKKDYFFVFNDSNLMVFNNGNTNYNISNGLKNHGVYKKAPDERINNLQLIFIYPNKDYANTLYRYLKEGYKHFPGLQSYIGLPVPRPDTDKSLLYSDIKNIKNELSKHLVTKFFDKPLYQNYFAFVILPFNSQNASDEEIEIYYLIKEELLSKGIISQFIDYHRINSEEFHFHLTNIAVAILGKIGGIPWKLYNAYYKELIVGYGENTTTENRILGNAVYFDNSGILKKIDFINNECEIKTLSNAIKNSILSYIKEDQKYPDRIIIHYYKPPNKKEIEILNTALKDLNLELPVVIVEINESKSKDHIVFDTTYKNSMPKSGTVVKLFNKNEFLLFNNLRYEEFPRSFIKEEYPIKIRIHYYNGILLDQDETVKIISQIYEFSRLYWKSIQQQSLPVTISYSKLIADFISHFPNHSIPRNEVTENYLWFI